MPEIIYCVVRSRIKFLIYSMLWRHSRVESNDVHEACDLNRHKSKGRRNKCRDLFAKYLHPRKYYFLRSFFMHEMHRKDSNFLSTLLIRRFAFRSMVENVTEKYVAYCDDVSDSFVRIKYSPTV